MSTSGCARSDLFSLGVITHPMLTGRLPNGATVARVRTKAAQNQLVHDSVLDEGREFPAWIDGVLRCRQRSTENPIPGSSSTERPSIPGSFSRSIRERDRAKINPLLNDQEERFMANWTPVCRVDDIPLLGARRVQRAQGMPVAVFRTADNQVFALLDRCPHKAGPLSQGIVAGQGVACPLHNWHIDLASGRAAAPDEGQTPIFECRVEDGSVLLDADELAGKACELTPAVAGPCAGRCG